MYEYVGGLFPLTAEVVLTDNGKPDDRYIVHVTANGNNVMEYNPDSSPMIREEIKRVPADHEICGNVYALISE